MVTSNSKRAKQRLSQLRLRRMISGGNRPRFSSVIADLLNTRRTHDHEPKHEHQFDDELLGSEVRAAVSGIIQA
jgi:hypothetical protein